MKYRLLPYAVMFCTAWAPAFGQSSAINHCVSAGGISAESKAQRSRLHAEDPMPKHLAIGQQGAISRDIPRSGAGDDCPIVLAGAVGTPSETGVAESVGGGDRGTLQGVIVTAQKYRQEEFNVPISMTVIGGPQFQRLGITNLEELQFFVPGMTGEYEGATEHVTIDGISNTFGQQGIVGMYLDEADVTGQGAFGLDLGTYDLARIEVLKGPQGTLYGEGSLGGTLRYITNKPELSGFQASIDYTALFDQYGAPENRVVTVVNSPVVENVFGVRVAADVDDGGGWVDQPAVSQKNINSKNLTDVRIEGRWRPREDLTVDATEVIHRASLGWLVGENPTGIYTQVFNQATTPRLYNDYNISNVTADWEGSLIRVINSANYFKNTARDTNVGQTFQFTPPPSPAFDDYYSGVTRNEGISDELRVADNGSGVWRWTLGGMYKRFDVEIPPYQYHFAIPGPAGSPLPPAYSFWEDVNSDSKSVFGDTSYPVFGRLVLGAGLRYFSDDENGLIAGDSAREEATFTSTDPRVYARYGLSSDVNVYASAAKGFRSGGFNGLGLPQYQPEHVWTYTLGTKMRVLDHTMSIDADMFFSEYGAYQIVGVAPPPAPPTSITSNGGDVRIKGGEAAVVWAPTRQWRLSVSGDYVNARFAHINVASDSYNVGDPVDLVPRYQVTASTERDFHWRDRPAFVRIDYTQRSPSTYRNRSLGYWYYSESDYVYLLGLHAGVNWTSNVEFGAFVQNLLNDRGFVDSDVIEMYAPREQPRTFGVNFVFKMD